MPCTCWTRNEALKDHGLEPSMQHSALPDAVLGLSTTLFLSFIPHTALQKACLNYYVSTGGEPFNVPFNNTPHIPTIVTACISAPWSTSNFTAAFWPVWLAECRAVSPSCGYVEGRQDLYSLSVQILVQCRMELPPCGYECAPVHAHLNMYVPMICWASQYMKSLTVWVFIALDSDLIYYASFGSDIASVWL